MIDGTKLKQKQTNINQVILDIYSLSTRVWPILDVSDRYPYGYLIFNKIGFILLLKYKQTYIGEQESDCNTDNFPNMYDNNFSFLMARIAG